MLRNSINSTQLITKAWDAKSIMAYCHYLVMKAQLTGNLSFDRHKPTAEENYVADQCRSVCEKISRSLYVCKINEIPDLLEYYDIAYRIGNKCLPDSTFIRRHKQRVFMAWKSGDHSVAESQIFGILTPEVVYHPGKADREYVTAYHSIKQNWIATLRKFDRFPEVTTYENYQRLTLIMRKNLDRDLGKDAADSKRRWYNHNRVDNLSKLSSQLLKSYRCFVSSLFPHVLDNKEVTELDTRILEELSNRSDLPPHDRDAFRLALQFNQQMA